MKIAAIGNEWSKKAIASKKFAPGVEWVWVDAVATLEKHPDAVLYADLDFRPEEARIGQLSRLLPRPVLIDSVIHTLAEIDRPFIRINGWPGMLERQVGELAIRDKQGKGKWTERGRAEEGRKEGKVGITKEVAAVTDLFERLGWPCRIVPDIPGMISGRILASVINEAYYTLQARVSTKEEIDEAMRLGTSYPFGPFEWERRIGLAAIYDLLGALSKTDSRYIPSEALKEELSQVKI